MRQLALAAAAIGTFAIALCAYAPPGDARSLEAVRKRGQLTVCAHPNSLPYASKTATPPGFQIELGKALAERMGFAFGTDWVLSQYQMPRADCDVMMDTIADREAQGETRLRISKPYYRTGAALVVPEGSKIASFDDLTETTKTGVMVGSTAGMTLDRRGVMISIFGFEEDALDSLTKGEIVAAMMTPTSAGYWNVKHPDRRVRVVGFDETVPEMTWNVAVGMVRPDDALRDAIDTAIEGLRADGTIKRIYANYGIEIQPPK